MKELFCLFERLQSFNSARSGLFEWSEFKFFARFIQRCWINSILEHGHYGLILLLEVYLRGALKHIGEVLTRIEW